MSKLQSIKQATTGANYALQVNWSRTKNG